MKENYFLSTLLSLALFSTNVFGQLGVSEVCNTFDSNLTRISIDTTGNWQIGNPTKTILNSSYNSQNSIVTRIDSLYENNDTSVFIATYPFIDDWRALPPSIEFSHRFLTDSITDYGEIEISFDNGISWINLLSDTLNINSGNPEWRGNYHVHENSNDTMYGKLVISGNSDGWIHSKFYKDIWTTDSIIMVKFTFNTDGVGRNEGWQIDNLCIAQDIISSVNGIERVEELMIYPNPNNGAFTIENSLNEISDLQIFDLKGFRVYSQRIDSKKKQRFQIELNPGMYIVQIGNGVTKQISKMHVK